MQVRFLLSAVGGKNPNLFFVGDGFGFAVYEEYPFAKMNIMHTMDQCLCIKRMDLRLVTRLKGVCFIENIIRNQVTSN